MSITTKETDNISCLCLNSIFAESLEISNLCMLGNVNCMLFLSSSDCFRNNYFRNTIRVSNSLDPDQARRFVGPELGPNCLQRLSAEADKGFYWYIVCVSFACIASFIVMFSKRNIIKG